MDVDEWIESRITWKAGKHNLPAGRTWLFTDLPPTDRSRFEAAAAKCDLGRPVLVFLESPDLWTVLGTKKIMSRHHERLQAFPLRQLVRVGPIDKPQHEWPVEQVRDWKRSWEYLSLKGTWWRKATIWVPCGGEAYALWSILHMFPGIYRPMDQRHVEPSQKG